MCPAIYKSYMGTDLHSCDEENDIGVLIDGELSFDKHITGSTKVNKANVMFGVIRRNFQYLDHKTFILLYKALIGTYSFGLCKFCVLIIQNETSMLLNLYNAEQLSSFLGRKTSRRLSATSEAPHYELPQSQG